MSDVVTVAVAGAGTAGIVIRLVVQGALDANKRILRRAKPRMSIKVTRADGAELTLTSESASEAATFLRNYLDEQEAAQRDTLPEQMPIPPDFSGPNPVTGEASQVGEVEND
ncbi:hypothetical protein [Streptomyces olivochromogenes]|uniref:hypothetical protein n=1 Tax=Streptomyces olivochromogenes TaxID=1963 RepID=UPI003680A85E